MRALVFNKDSQYVIEERPMPEPDVGEALFKTHYSGICGTDLHAPMLGNYTHDVVIGHEFAGEVAAVGPGVSDWRVGDPRRGASEGRPLRRMRRMPRGMAQPLQRCKRRGKRGYRHRWRNGAVCAASCQKAAKASR